MGIFSKAEWKPISGNHYKEAMQNHLGLVLHVQDGNGGLFGWFSNPSAEVSANFWTGKNGEFEQYVDTDNSVAWAQMGGNSTYNSIETEGLPNEPLTLLQILNIASLYRWGHKKYSWPYKVANKPGERGFGWHGMGGASWGSHFDCPGDLRKSKRPTILKIARGVPVRLSKKETLLRKELLAFKKEHKIKNKTYIIGSGVRKAAGIV